MGGGQREGNSNRSIAKESRPVTAAIIALSFAIAASPVPVDAPNEDLQLLACAIEGEVAGRLGPLRDEAGRCVAHVAMNRAEAGWWHDPSLPGGALQQTLLADFHGMDPNCRLEVWALSIAWEAMHRTRDAAEGALFLLSFDDLREMGGSDSPVRCFEWGSAGLCFFMEWGW
jgi:hypothetical protein